MRKSFSKEIALGGMMAALAVVIMSLGGMIPLATFVCPMLCILLLQFVARTCGSRIAWAWYGAVALLSLLLGPDKEAAAVFVFLGYYPIVKPWIERQKLSLLLKLVFFNAAVLLMYWLLMNLFGMAELSREFEEAGVLMTGITLVLGNITFFMLDFILSRGLRRRYG